MKFGPLLQSLHGTLREDWAMNGSAFTGILFDPRPVVTPFFIDDLTCGCNIEEEIGF